MRDHEERPIACNLGALDAAGRARRQALADRLADAITDVDEEADGYTFHYAAEALPVVTEFIALERRCCPFLRFVLDVAADDGPLQLSITGATGAKAFIAAELGLMGGNE